MSRISLLVAYSLIGLATLFGANCCYGDLLQFTLEDQSGDPRDNFDVVAVQVTFDNFTGGYHVKATADPAHPFTGHHLLYLSVFNPDAGSTDPAVSFFGVVRFGLSTTTPTTMLQRSGNQAVLKGWEVGDRVASYDAFGLPAGVPSLQSVLGGTLQSFSQSDEIRDTDIIRAVPEPAAGLQALVVAAVGKVLGARPSRGPSISP
jgi:hypothetical protein